MVQIQLLNLHRLFAWHSKIRTQFCTYVCLILTKSAWNPQVKEFLQAFTVIIYNSSSSAFIWWNTKVKKQFWAYACLISSLSLYQTLKWKHFFMFEILRSRSTLSLYSPWFQSFLHETLRLQSSFDLVSMSKKQFETYWARNQDSREWNTKVTEKLQDEFELFFKKTSRSRNKEYGSILCYM